MEIPKKEKFEAGHVFQISPEVDVFGGCFIVATEIKDWGIQGYCVSPGIDGAAYFRPKWKDIEFIGPTAWDRVYFE